MLLFPPLHEFFPEKCRVYLKNWPICQYFACASQFSNLPSYSHENQSISAVGTCLKAGTPKHWNNRTQEKRTPEHWNTPEYRNTRTPKHAGIPEYPATPKLSETLQNIEKKMTIMKKIIERIFKNLLGILNEDKRTKIIRANWHIEANKSRKDLRVKTF